MFFDEVKIFIKSGDGGDGCVAFRREKYVPFGGPSGGNGGHGGNIVFVVERNLNTLVHFKKRSHFKAERGGRGSGKNQQGKTGDERLVPVPPGTMIYDADSGELLADLVEDGQQVVLARGGAAGVATPLLPRPPTRRPAWPSMVSLAKNAGCAWSSSSSPTWGSLVCPTPARVRCFRW